MSLCPIQVIRDTLENGWGLRDSFGGYGTVTSNVTWGKFLFYKMSCNPEVGRGEDGSITKSPKCHMGKEEGY